MSTEIIKLEDDIIRDEGFIAIMDDTIALWSKTLISTKFIYHSESHTQLNLRILSIVYLPIQILLRKVLIKL